MKCKCERCHAVFIEPDVTTYEEPSEYWGAQASEEITVATCPVCGSEDIIDVNDCIACGEPTESEEKIFCNECHKLLDDLLSGIQQVMGIDYEQLQDIIAEHFGW